MSNALSNAFPARQPPPSRTYLARMRRAALLGGLPPPEGRLGAVAIVCAASESELYWCLDEFGDPNAFEYREISPGEALLVRVQVQPPGEGDDPDAPDDDLVYCSHPTEPRLSEAMTEAYAEDETEWHAVSAEMCRSTDRAPH